MNGYFKRILRIPVDIQNGDYYYNADRDGDCFDSADAEYWLS